MDTNIRLSDGNSIPQIGYGVWRLEDEQAALLVGRAIDSGYRHIDTAQGYNNESGVGQAVASAGVPRNDLYVTSKLRTRDQGYDNALRSFEESLTRLRLDYLDLFLIHWPMPVHDRYVETWKALIKLKADGRVRSIGVSNFNLPHLERLVDETGVAPAVNRSNCIRTTSSVICGSAMPNWASPSRATVRSEATGLNHYGTPVLAQ